MSGASDSGGEDLDRQEEGRNVWTHVQHKLRQSEDGDESSSRSVVGYAGPDGIENDDANTAPELLTDSSDKVGEKDADVESRKVSLTQCYQLECR